MRNLAPLHPSAADGESPFPILAASSLADERTRVLKHGDTFTIFDHYGDISPAASAGRLYEGRIIVLPVVLPQKAIAFFLSSTCATTISSPSI